MKINLKFVVLMSLLQTVNISLAARCTSLMPSDPNYFPKPTDSIYDVKKAPYLAVGDGSTDDTAAIQCAIDDASADQGGRVYLPIGEYKHTGLVLYGNAVHLVGTAETGLKTEGTRLKYAGTDGTQIYIGTAGEFARKNHIRNLTLVTETDQTSGHFIQAEGIAVYKTETDEDGNPVLDPDGNPVQKLVTSTNVARLLIENVDIHAAPAGPNEVSPSHGSGFNGILIDNVNTAILRNIRITGLTGDYAIKLTNNSPEPKAQTDIIRLENVLYNSTITYGSPTTDGLVIEDKVYTVNTFGVDMLNAKRGFVIGNNDPDKPGPAYLFLTEITAENAYSHGVVVNNHDFFLSLKNCYVHISQVHGIDVTADAGPTHISGCTIQRNGHTQGDGFPSAYGMGIQVASQAGGSIVGNVIEDNHTAGIYLIPGTDGFSITTNNVNNSAITTNQDWGIVANNGTKNNVIANNVVKCNTTNNVAVGAVTNSIINNNVVVPASSPDC